MTKPVEANPQPVWAQPMQPQTDPITSLATSSMSSGTAIPIAQKRKYLQIFSIDKVCKYFNLVFAHTKNEQIKAFIAQVSNNELDDASILDFFKSMSKHCHPEYVYELEISDENTRFELAKLFAKNNVETSAFISSFKIKSNEKLFEIATIALLCYPSAVFYIDHYNLTQEQRFQLVKRFVQDLKYIKYFNLTPEQYFEVAEIIAKKDPVDFIKTIKFYTFDSQQNFAHAIIVTKINVQYTLDHLKNFNLNQEQRFQLLKLIATMETQQSECGFWSALYITALHVLKDFNLNDEQNKAIVNLCFKTYCKLIKPTALSITHILNIIKPITISLDLHSKLIPFLDISFSMTNPELKKQAIESLERFKFLCALQPNQEDIVAFFTTFPKILSSLYEVRDANVYWPVLESIIDLSPLQFERISAKTVEKQIALLPLAAMNTDKLEELIEKVKKSDVHDLKLRNPLVKTFGLIKNDRKLTAEIRAKILSWIMNDHKNKKQMIERCLMIIAIYNLNANEALSQSNPNYESILIEAFQKAVPFMNVDSDLLRKLMQTFLVSRNPTAIFIYTGCLATLNNPKVIENLALFINSVLEGNFQEVRRDVQHNPHLKYLKEKHPQILEKFHQGFELNKNVTSAQEISNTPRWELIEIIIKNAFAHKHITASEFPYFSHDIPTLEKLLKTTTNIKANATLHLIRLLQPGATEETFNKCYEAFEKALPKDSEFFNDLKAIKKLFEEKNEGLEQVILSSTDNPYEILLCGTEVDGSCQRINGNPSLNQGLLGYLLNGHTRLITLKEPGNNKISGRAIIRLLVNNNSEPVLLIERIYPEALNAKYKSAIMKFAKSIATELQVSLVGTECKGKHYPKTITCYSTRTPEYVDTLHGIYAQYTITNGVNYD